MASLTPASKTAVANAHLNKRKPVYRMWYSKSRKFIDLLEGVLGKRCDASKLIVRGEHEAQAPDTGTVYWLATKKQHRYREGIELVTFIDHTGTERITSTKLDRVYRDKLDAVQTT